MLSVSYLQEHTRKGGVSHSPCSILRAQLGGADFSGVNGKDALGVDFGPGGVNGKDGVFETFAELFAFGAKNLICNRRILNGYSRTS